MSFFDGFKKQLLKTKKQMSGGLSSLFRENVKIDAEFFHNIKTLLLRADVGEKTTNTILGNLKKHLQTKDAAILENIKVLLCSEITDILSDCEKPLVIPKKGSPFMTLVVGVNGCGKTTTVAKLGHYFKMKSLSVLLVAADTYRAAAGEQLAIWGEKLGIPVFSKAPGSDSASVVFDAFFYAKKRHIDVVFADTAGRLHTNHGLMEELKKIARATKKATQSGPNEILHILDGTLGRDTLTQFHAFNSALGTTGLAITKLDGSAKGGAVLSIAEHCKHPIRFVGFGEKSGDLLPFNAQMYSRAIVFD